MICIAQHIRNLVQAGMMGDVLQKIKGLLPSWLMDKITKVKNLPALVAKIVAFIHKYGIKLSDFPKSAEEMKSRQSEMATETVNAMDLGAAGQLALILAMVIFSVGAGLLSKAMAKLTERQKKDIDDIKDLMD